MMPVIFGAIGLLLIILRLKRDIDRHNRIMLGKTCEYCKYYNKHWKECKFQGNSYVDLSYYCKRCVKKGEKFYWQEKNEQNGK